MPKRNDGNESAVQLNKTSTIIVPNGSVFPPTANTVPPSQVNIPASGSVSTPFPTATTAATYAWWDSTGVCPSGLDARAVERVIMKLVVSHFINPANIASPYLIAAGCVYNENPNISGLRVVPFSIWDAATANKKPSIIIKRGQQTVQRLAIGDRAQRNTDTGSNTYAYTRLVVGEHYVICASQMNGEIEELAVEAFNMLTGYSPVVRMLLPFQDFAVTALTGLQAGDELGTSFTTAIKIEYKYELGWTVSPPITFALTYNGNTNTGGTAPVDTNTPYLTGSTITVATAGTLVKTGHTFLGWNTAANGSGTAYAAGATFAISADTVLYAQWS